VGANLEYSNFNAVKQSQEKTQLVYP